jgi:small membrane protein
MTLFQVVTIAALLFLTIVVLLFVKRNVIGKRGAAFWASIFLAAAAAIAMPEMTARAAHAMGIGRGTDLVLYASILAGLGAFFITHARMRRIESELTTLVRQIALRETDRSAGQLGD